MHRKNFSKRTQIIVQTVKLKYQAQFNPNFVISKLFICIGEGNIISFLEKNKQFKMHTSLNVETIRKRVNFINNIGWVGVKSLVLEQKFYNLMFIIQKIRRTITKVDMFASSEMLRYDEDAQYHTFTGGVISMGIILTVIAGFFSMISETINKTSIDSNLNALISSSPTAYTLKVNTDSMFMFGIQIQSTNLQFIYDFNAPRRYFDITARQFVLRYGIMEVLETIPLVKCTDEHWMMLPQIVKNKDLVMYESWLCPPLNSQYLLQGNFFSEVFASAMITVEKCTNESDPSRPCYPQNQIDDLFNQYDNFYFTVNYINTVVNPGEINYLSYYLESMDYAIFSANTGSELYYLFSDYEIKTDTSIWPFSSYQDKIGVLIPDRVSAKPYMMGTSPKYAVAYFTKSTQSLYYSRQVQKLSVVISYMGGLVGAVSAVLFILKIYTDLSLEVSIARNIFTISQDQQQGQGHSINKKRNQKVPERDKNQQKNFNIFVFVKLYVYKLFQGFKFTESWKETKQIQMLREEIGKHLDVKVLLQRLTNLQRCLSFVFDDDQLKCLKYLKKISLAEVKKMRTTFSNEIEQEEQIVEQTQAQSQLFVIPNNNHFANKEDPKNNLFQVMSSENVSSVNSSASSENLEKFKAKVAKKRSNRGSQNSLRQYNFNDAIFNRKPFDCFYSLQKMKQTSILSKKIWQNLNENVKEEFTNKDGIDNFAKDKDQRTKSFLRIQIPSIIMDKIN